MATDAGEYVSSTSLALPHSLSWFKTSPCACSNWSNERFCDVAFMCFDYLSIYRLVHTHSENDDGYFFKFIDEFKAHEQNVNSVSFPLNLNTDKHQRCFITCGNDRSLRLWINESNRYTLRNEVNFSTSITPSTCSSCYANDALYILSTGLTGQIVVWEPANVYLGGKPIIGSFKKTSPSACLLLPSSSDSDTLVAVVGYADGDIACYKYHPPNSSSKAFISLLFQKSAHNFEICSLTPLQSSDGTYDCFATAGRDADVRCWSLGENQCKYSYHFRFDRKNDTGETAPISHGKAWIPLASCGANDSDQFLAFDPRGTLCAFRNSGKPTPLNSLALKHTGLVFSLLRVPNSSPGLFISFGKDGHVIAWMDISRGGSGIDLTPVSTLLCIPAKIASMSQSPGSSGSLAIGLSDGNLFLIRNLQPPAPKVFTSTTRLSPLPPSSAAVGINALAWHPDVEFEHLLAIGSSKGHVDIVDMSKNQKRGRSFNHLGSPVYRVVWGPLLFPDASIQTEHRLLVYAVASGSVYLLVSQKKPPVDLGPKFRALLPNTGDHKLADIAFRTIERVENAYSYLIGLGSMSGMVNLFGLSRSDGEIVGLSRIDIHKKCISTMVWSHHDEEEDKFWLAVGSAESFITVIDATDHLKAAKSSSTSSSFNTTSCFATLQGHGSRITSLEWSPIDRDLLVSGSYDCTATVWRVGLGTSKPIANYRNHFSTVVACTWSPFHPEMVLSAEDAGRLAGWRLDEQPNTAPPTCRKNRNPRNRVPTSVEPVVTTTTESEKTVETPSPPPPPQPAVVSVVSGERTNTSMSKKPSLLPSLFSTPSASDVSLPSLTSTPPLKLQKKFEELHDFVAFLRDPASLPEDRILPEFDLLRCPDAKSRRRLVFFTEQEAMKHLEVAQQVINKNPRLDNHFSLLLWVGLGGLVAKKCVEMQYLPFWLMWALELLLKGPSASHYSGGINSDGDFFQHKILQLTASKEHGWAATLLVCAGRSEEAVRLLLRCDHPKEALLIFRLRLDPRRHAELLSECLQALARNQTSGGLRNLALVHLAMDQREQAVATVRVPKTAPLLDRLVSLWTSHVFQPDDKALTIQLVIACITYAAHLSIESERAAFLTQWLASGLGRTADFLLRCARFLLAGIEEEEEKTTELIPVLDCEPEILVDREPSLEEAPCLAAISIDFAVTCVTMEATQLSKSFGTLKEHHPDSWEVLAERMRLTCSSTTAPEAFKQICVLFCE